LFLLNTLPVSYWRHIGWQALVFPEGRSYGLDRCLYEELFSKPWCWKWSDAVSIAEGILSEDECMGRQSASSTLANLQGKDFQE